MLGAQYQKTLQMCSVKMCPKGLPASQKNDDNAVKIYARRVEYRIRECGLYAPARASQESGNALPNLHQGENLLDLHRLEPCQVDARSVTNAQFYRFICETNCRLRHAKNFLKEWRDIVPLDHTVDLSVVWIDLDDARAFADLVSRTFADRARVAIRCRRKHA